MGMEPGRLSTSNRIRPNSISKPTENGYGVVYDVILTNDSKIVKQKKLQGTYPIGAIQFRLLNDKTTADELLPIAYPLNKNINSLPLRNEIVIIHTPSTGGDYYYTKSAEELNPYITANPDLISSKFQSKNENNNETAKDYQKVSSTNIARTNTSESTPDYDGFGEYYNEQIDGNIHKLKLYEGDTLIESRFGQSIRLSGYNNTENSFSPTLILRNGENPQTLNSDNGISTEEDINRDGNIILLGSNQYQLPFQPGTIDDNGKNDFETTPLSFKNYPNDLKGNQILLNSDRLIFSAKSSEMIFYSKGNYGFISDGELSIDNKFGIRMNVNDDINITTNDRNVNINSGNGNINLGNTNLESLVKGETLVQLMTELITAIEAMTVATPSGTSTPPINVASFSKVKSQLRTMLSNLNKTS